MVIVRSVYNLPMKQSSTPGTAEKSDGWFLGSGVFMRGNTMPDTLQCSLALTDKVSLPPVSLRWHASR